MLRHKPSRKISNETIMLRPNPTATIFSRHSFILREEEAPVCVACNAVITVKRILIECADLLEVRKKYFEEKSLCSLFRNVIPEMIFDFLREIGVFYKI